MRKFIAFYGIVDILCRIPSNASSSVLIDDTDGFMLLEIRFVVYFILGIVNFLENDVFNGV